MKANPSGKFLNFILFSFALALNLCAHAAAMPPNIVGANSFRPDSSLPFRHSSFVI